MHRPPLQEKNIHKLPPKPITPSKNNKTTLLEPIRIELLPRKPVEKKENDCPKSIVSLVNVIQNNEQDDTSKGVNSFYRKSLRV